MTRSDFLRSVTPSPRLAMVPLTSWPRIPPGPYAPWTFSMSVPQIPADASLIKTSPGWSLGVGTSFTSA